MKEGRTDGEERRKETDCVLFCDRETLRSITREFSEGEEAKGPFLCHKIDFEEREMEDEQKKTEREDRERLCLLTVVVISWAS